MINLETNVQKITIVANCQFIHSFEDKILIQTNDNKKVTSKLFKFNEGKLHLLDEKIGYHQHSDVFFGPGNLGILRSFAGDKLLNFSTGKLLFLENKVKDRKWFYNSLVGPTEFPEFVEEICPQHLLY